MTKLTLTNKDFIMKPNINNDDKAAFTATDLQIRAIFKTNSLELFTSAERHTNNTPLHNNNLGELDIDDIESDSSTVELNGPVRLDSPTTTSTQGDHDNSLTSIKTMQLTPPNSPVRSPEFNWAFFNCPATMKMAGLLLLTGGLFTLTMGAITASTYLAVSSAAMITAGVGTLLGFYGQFNQCSLKKRANNDSATSLDNDSRLEPTI